MAYTAKEKADRKTFLLDQMLELQDRTKRILRGFGKSDEAIEIATAEMTIVEQRVENAITYYFDYLLDPYRKLHGFGDDEPANRDKMSAFMGLAIVTMRPFRSRNNRTTCLATSLINERLALRNASIVLGVDREQTDRGIRRRSDHVHPLVTRHLLLNLSDLGKLSRLQAANGRHIGPTDPVMGWVIQSMQLYGLAFGQLSFEAAAERLPPPSPSATP